MECYSDRQPLHYHDESLRTMDLVYDGSGLL